MRRVNDDLMNYIHHVLVYVRGRHARGRHRDVQPRFSPPVWNMYETILQGNQESNNNLENLEIS